jgi:integrase
VAAGERLCVARDRPVLRPPRRSALAPPTITDRFEYLVRKSGLPPVRLHDLRHCAATYLRHGGADLKEVQETLGHSSITLTSDTYTSVILEMQNKTADAAAHLLPRQSGRNT